MKKEHSNIDEVVSSYHLKQLSVSNFSLYLFSFSR